MTPTISARRLSTWLKSDAVEHEQPKRSILEKVGESYDFHDNRKQAAKRPRTAQDYLSPYAEIKINVVKARGLTGADWNPFGDATSDPFCEIYVNDELKKKTDTKPKTLTPIWNWECELKISKPGTVVCIKVFDEDLIGENDFLGYLEFPVADLPSGQCISGWFILFPPGQLQDEAPARLSKTLKGPCEETCGAVYLELTFRIISGDLSDEFYAWCLPQPTFSAFHPTTKTLDAQLLIDPLEDIKEYTVDDLMLPLLSGLIYIITWRELPVSMFALLVAVGCSLRPRFVPAGVLFTSATLLLLLCSSKRRRKMSAHPSLVPLSDEGYKLISELQDTDKMVAFLERVIRAMDGLVEDSDMLRSFAAFSAHLGTPTTTFDDLKKQLSESAQKLDAPFVTFLRSPPYLPGCLVHLGHRTGEVVSCINPLEAPDFKYKVKFCRDNENTEKESDSFYEEEALGEDLELRLDFRWTRSSVVLALIPDVTETLIMEAAESLAKIVLIVRRMSKFITGVVQWQNKQASLGVVLGLYIVACVFGLLGCMDISPYATTTLCWLREGGTVAVVTLLFVMDADFFVSFVAQVQAYGLWRQHRAKTSKDWGFLIQGDDAEDRPRMTFEKKDDNSKNVENSKNAKWDFVSFFGCAACVRKHAPTSPPWSPQLTPRSPRLTPRLTPREDHKRK